MVSTVFAASPGATATTSATVVVPIAIVDTRNLSFGELAAGTGGTVVLSTSGVASTIAGDVVLTGGTGAAAEFTITGQADANFSIDIADDDLTHTDTLTTMPFATIYDFDRGSADSPAASTLMAGEQTLYVGGTLVVGDGQAPGVYSGTVTATVNYN